MRFSGSEMPALAAVAIRAQTRAMKFLEGYRDREAVEKFAEMIRGVTSQPWTLMEVCGGQTHAIMRFAIDTLLPDEITLLHGPGCPVCVTPIELIDEAVTIARMPNVIFCSYGDMLRVPGSQGDLFKAKSEGADVRMVYSPMDALTLARDNPDREVVFFAVGFETTAPANAMAVFQAKEQGVENFSVVVSHVLVPPAMEALLSSPDCRVQGFLAAGHVCTVVGFEEYLPMAAKYKIPMVVTGFEPVDILQGIYMCVCQLEEGRAEVENQYSRVVRQEGNLPALDVMKRVFDVTDREWRGMGTIPMSGFGMAEEYAGYDAVRKFGVTVKPVAEETECMSGLILQGLKKPNECPHFGERCTPENPMGATMVSNEGACSAYYRYRSEG
jgi:hydrogenase expression/formation protein HypD